MGKKMEKLNDLRETLRSIHPVKAVDYVRNWAMEQKREVYRREKFASVTEFQERKEKLQRLEKEKQTFSNNVSMRRERETKGQHESTDQTRTSRQNDVFFSVLAERRARQEARDRQLAFKIDRRVNGPASREESIKRQQEALDKYQRMKAEVEEQVDKFKAEINKAFEDPNGPNAYKLNEMHRLEQDKFGRGPEEMSDNRNDRNDNTRNQNKWTEKSTYQNAQSLLGSFFDSFKPRNRNDGESSEF